MQKNQVNQHVVKISQLLSLKTIHLFSICILLFLFLFETFFYKNSQVIYALFLVIFTPIILSKQIKKEDSEESVLPYLTQKYGYSKHALKLQKYSFLVDSMSMFLLQIGNFLFPYEVFWVQYTPLFLLIMRILLRFPLAFVIRTFLHHKLMNNLI